MKSLYICNQVVEIEDIICHKGEAVQIAFEGIDRWVTICRTFNMFKDWARENYDPKDYSWVDDVTTGSEVFPAFDTVWENDHTVFLEPFIEAHRAEIYEKVMPLLLAEA